MWHRVGGNSYLSGIGFTAEGDVKFCSHVHEMSYAIDRRTGNAIDKAIKPLRDAEVPFESWTDNYETITKVKPENMTAALGAFGFGPDAISTAESLLKANTQRKGRDAGGEAGQAR
jgi:hypothetical protein